jgi:histidine triad (HIT) family protein
MSQETKNCIFCRIIQRTEPASIVYEDDSCIVIMDIQPVNSGHLLVIPKKHIPYLDDSKNDIGEYMFKIGIKMASALKSSDVKCEGVNYLMADGEAAGQEVFHAHLHVFPRFKSDGFGFRFPERYYEMPERKSLDDIASKIKSSIK